VPSSQDGSGPSHWVRVDADYIFKQLSACTKVCDELGGPRNPVEIEGFRTTTQRMLCLSVLQLQPNHQEEES
jgi:hypothetical protein